MEGIMSRIKELRKIVGDKLCESKLLGGWHGLLCGIQEK
ncbi:hypothetical protein SELR_14480 [Selenomonas ruminantium subsp. lactilytica TAM6421]|uniref:Uncharacterized protein n=1 Tax=Selenomonas ruminantium subsp. lactilytica (strain NBRC 103574 / TAM6421) TaxID=927704 RepID=I0GQW9_SELRL|nr:hypothetical protein SELR_14480 [Selenomonas ruminantium subsp. lactilytica TAM6421]